MTRVALVVAYDGRGFCGWQTQPGGGAVQDWLERALGRLVGKARVATVCAGRTDAGVHGLGQVVHFDTDITRPLSAWVRGVNSFLPDTIAVQSARVVREGFSARFCAQERAYLYLLHSAPVRHPLYAGRVGWTHRPLDARVMQAAAECLLGTHDFSAFRAAQCQAASPVRTLNRLEITSTVGASGSIVSLHITANAFLHHMIRNIVGLLVYIGDERQPVAWASKVLAGRDRRAGAPTFDASGLYFLGARYPEADDMPAPLAPGSVVSALPGTGLGR